MTVRWSALLIATLLAAPSSLALAASTDVVRGLAGLVGAAQPSNLIFADLSMIIGQELTLPGARHSNGVIVAKVVPGSSTLILKYKIARAKYAAGEASSHAAPEGALAASVPILSLSRVDPQSDENLVDTAEQRASHESWGTARDETPSNRSNSNERI